MVRQHDIPLGNVSQNGGPGGKKVSPSRTTSSGKKYIFEPDSALV